MGAVFDWLERTSELLLVAAPATAVAASCVAGGDADDSPERDPLFSSRNADGRGDANARSASRVRRRPPASCQGTADALAAAEVNERRAPSESERIDVKDSVLARDAVRGSDAVCDRQPSGPLLSKDSSPGQIWGHPASPLASGGAAVGGV
jgi:hypothetical protein